MTAVIQVERRENYIMQKKKNSCPLLPAGQAPMHMDLKGKLVNINEWVRS